MSTTRILFSASEEYFTAAERQIREEFPNATVERLGPDLGGVAGEDLTLGRLAAVAAKRPFFFVQYLSEEIRRIRPADADLDKVADAAAEIAAERARTSDPLAVHSWVSGTSPFDYGSGQLQKRIGTALEDLGHRIVRSGADQIVTAAISRRGVSLGFTTSGDCVTEWPGGRVRLARPKEQISRAEFKLEELLRETGDLLPSSGRAMDLGASPGGWTRILRERGLEVWAVDPAALDSRLTDDQRVHHERTTAGRFLESTATRFDLAVSDMRMDPVLAARVMLDATARLGDGALAVVTLKLGTRRPLETVRNAVDVLSRRYEMLLARQLQHNRHEITYVGRLRERNRPAGTSRRRRADDQWR
ncbi:SAM-dependent methyltransferase [Actinomadura meridiana]|uniref:SAM-dependent methyltransferase n=1 Tax=Actinomadura meridiana TaxID=559626 RepID=A0ABP8C9I2_9ACTN